MPLDRISRGTPIKATKSEQEALLAAVDRNPTLRADIEAALGRTLTGLTVGAKLLALEEHFLAGKTLAAVNAATRAHLETHTLAEQARSQGKAIEAPRAAVDDAA